MNAGLLGEHLASPRTAQKTNQSTALDPKTAKGGDSASKDGFASFVSKESQPSANDAPAPENAVAAAQTPPSVTNPAQAAALEDGLIAAPALEAEAPPPNPAPEADAAPRAIPGLTALSVDGEALNGPAAHTSQAPTGEVLAQDPRIRTQTEARETTRAPRGETVKFVDGSATLAADAAAESEITVDPEPNIDQRSRAPAGLADADAEIPRPAAQFGSAEAAATEAQARQTGGTDVSSFDRLLAGGLTRDGLNAAPEPVLTTAPVSTTANTSSTVSLNALTPTAPSIPLATPTELTGIIVNAINSGLDPQEQLVVQMDPPELGRVMIDFKFDAQGLQQVVVTTENPEALKRLRELHFELTQALKEHGLSEQNMSFRQEADGRSQDTWGSDDPARQDAQYFAAEERRASPSATPTGPSRSVQERLDLLL